MKGNYWSCTKFADWLRGTPKPYAGTAEEWCDWKKIAKTKKIRYWLTEEGLDSLQNFVRWPLDLFNNVRYYVDNRWVVETHALTSNLKRGQWHDLDTRLLHACFDELVNFVEVEQAWHAIACSDEERKKYKTPWYRKIFCLGFWRCPEAGLAHLEWAAGLKNDEDWIDKTDPGFGQPTHQALAAQQTMRLYKWWKEERPQRPDPMDASGWSDYCEERRQAVRAENGDDDDFLWIGCDKDELDRERSSKILEICRKMEQEREDEDTEMLICLIKIRKSLWS